MTRPEINRKDIYKEYIMKTLGLILKDLGSRFKKLYQVYGMMESKKILRIRDGGKFF